MVFIAIYLLIGLLIATVGIRCKFWYVSDARSFTPTVLFWPVLALIVIGIAIGDAGEWLYWQIKNL